MLFLIQPGMVLAYFAVRADLLGQVPPVVHQDLRVYFCQEAFQTVSSQHLLEHGVVPPEEQDLAFPLLEHHQVPVSPFLQPDGFLRMAAQPSGLPGTPPAFVSVTFE